MPRGRFGVAVACALVALSPTTTMASAGPAMAFFLDGAVLGSPGSGEVQPDLSHCQPGDWYPCPGGLRNHEYACNYTVVYRLEDETVIGYDYGTFGAHSTTGWDHLPTENDINVSTAVGAGIGAAASQVARGTADQIGANVAGQVTSSTGTVFSGLASSISYGVRWLVARASVA
jgi:hypothetical protein